MESTCTAGVANGSARCRNPVPCVVHLDGIPPAPRPDVILVKINVGKVPDRNGRGGDRVRALEEAGVQLCERSPERAMKLAEVHLAQAQALGRSAIAFREGREGVTAGSDAAHAVSPEGQEVFYPEARDSGAAVFGRLGVQEVSLNGLISELKLAGFRIIGTHLLARDWKPPVRWVIELSRSGEECASFPWPLFREFTSRTFGQVDVWANPRDRRGEVVHTVNCGERRGAETQPKGYLRYAVGDWAFKSV